MLTHLQLKLVHLYLCLLLSWFVIVGSCYCYVSLFLFVFVLFCNYPLFPSYTELEWKLVYVGSAEDEKYDQELDSVLVGPVSIGRNKFVFQVSKMTETSHTKHTHTHFAWERQQTHATTTFNTFHSKLSSCSCVCCRPCFFHLFPPFSTFFHLFPSLFFFSLSRPQLPIQIWSLLKI